MARWRALIVDDSPSMRRQLFHALRRVGELDAVEATDGADAWRKLAGAKFDLVLTDVNMPILDGLKLVSMVRSGGAHQENNYLPSCGTCNNYRWHYSPEEVQLILKLGSWLKTKITSDPALAGSFIKHELALRKRRKKN